MDLPTSGPIVAKHNQMIGTQANYSYFVNNNTHGFRVVNTDLGSLLLAYSNQALAQAVFDRILGDSHSLLIIEGVTMIEFFDLIVGESEQETKSVSGLNRQPSQKSIAGILLNLPIDFVAGRSDFMPNDQLLMHLFTREEFDYFRSV